jgi:hypothetical protein
MRRLSTLFVAVLMPVVVACSGGSGAPGSKGDTGATGSTGAMGLTGATGVTGATGAQGETGATGPSGTNGIDGYPGAQGPAGATGADGAAGATGATGAQGLRFLGAWASSSAYLAGDAVSIAGASYVAASANTASQPPSARWKLLAAAGATGATGVSGVTGAQGVTGATGSSVTGQSVGPGANCPNGGAEYFSVDGNRYVCNGVDGHTGATGGQGVQGAQGIAGQTGAQGVSGAQGQAGATGAQGLAGATGSQGLMGSNGATGATGAQGQVGATGAQGLAGATGSQGLMGSNGATGATGVQGLIGPTGAVGATGAQGATGNQGPTGAQGITGTQGVAGNQGATGSTGATGATGIGGLSRLVMNFEGAGSTSIDSSGQGNNGTLSAGGIARTANGHNNTGALAFVGPGAVTVPDSPSLDITENITLEAYINVTAYPANQAFIISKTGQYALLLTNSGTLLAQFVTGAAASTANVGGSAPLPIGTTAQPIWTAVAATYDGVSVNIYVNGVLTSQTPASYGPLAVTANALSIGGLANSTQSFSGTLDEVRVSAYAKTFRSVPPYIKLGMSNYQTVAMGDIVAFDTVAYANRMTSNNNGINLRAGHTYRLEAIPNTYAAGSYVGFQFFNATANLPFGPSCYTGNGQGSSPAYGFHAGCLEFFTPAVDTLMQTKVIDATGTLITPYYNSYFIATELQ